MAAAFFFVGEEVGGLLWGLALRCGAQLASAGAAVPHGVFFLPVVAQLHGYVLLGEVNPLWRREERAFALAHVFGHEQVASLHHVVPVVVLGWAKRCIAL